jgi:hypothetical protein
MSTISALIIKMRRQENKSTSMLINFISIIKTKKERQRDVRLRDKRGRMTQPKLNSVLTGETKYEKNKPNSTVLLLL